jgi:hypothetical protein
VRADDLAGLRNLASHLSDRFVAVYVLYTGQQTLSYGGKIKALPIEALWLLVPQLGRIGELLSPFTGHGGRSPCQAGDLGEIAAKAGRRLVSA